MRSFVFNKLVCLKGNFTVNEFLFSSPSSSCSPRFSPVPPCVELTKKILTKNGSVEYKSSRWYWYSKNIIDI